MTGAVKLIILDRDGVINEDSAAYIKSPAEWHPLAGSIEAIAKLNAAGFEIVIVSNQSGIGRGLFSEESLAAIHRKLTNVITAAGGAIAGIYFCPHTPDDNCDCRKPQPGLLQKIAADFDVSLEGVPVVGDKASDLEMARRIGARPILVLTGYGRETAASIPDDPVETFPDLAAAAATLIAEAAS